MELTSKQKFFPLIIIAGFVLCVLLSSLLGSMILTGDVYIPAVPDLHSMSFLDSVGYFTDSLTSSALQLLVLFLSGYSSLSLCAALAICAYRGVTFGYTTSLLARDALIFPKDHLTILPFFKPDVGISVLILYFISTAVIAVFAYFAYRRFEILMSRTTGEGRPDRRYIITFAVISGAVFLCDIIKLLLIHSL